MTTRTANPAVAPSVAGRQPRTAATASTTVKASTTSTSEARNEAAIAGPALVQTIMRGPPVMKTPPGRRLAGVAGVEPVGSGGVKAVDGGRIRRFVGADGSDRQAIAMTSAPSPLWPGSR